MDLLFPAEVQDGQETSISNTHFGVYIDVLGIARERSETAEFN